MTDDVGGRSLGGGPAGGAARVRRTGLALVHEGETVLPAAGSAAEAELVAEDGRMTINYYFPVEIEVREGGERADPRHAVERALQAFAHGVENRG